MFKKILFIALVLSGLSFSAEEEKVEGGKFAHESELSIVLTSGNSDTQTYSAKQTTSYELDKNLLRITGGYLLGRADGQDKSKKWDLGLRYERAMSEKMSLYSGYTLDSDVFAGLDLRHAIDAGVKYFFLKTDGESLFTEVGYRFNSENRLAPTTSVSSHLGRVYGEWNWAWSKVLSHKIALEYLPNFTTWQDYRINFLPSFSVVLSQVLALKLGYTMQYRNVPATPGKKTLDTVYTTSLIAKF